MCTPLVWMEAAIMKKIGRPRKAKRKENISVNLDKSLINEVEDQLSWKQSRSQWISEAIKNKLSRKLPDIDEYSLTLLCFTARNHKDAPRWLIRELSYFLDSTTRSQVEETVEEQ